MGNNEFIIMGAGPTGIVTAIEMKLCLIEPMVFEQKKSMVKCDDEQELIQMVL
jgi:thioredoxin reductase